MKRNFLCAIVLFLSILPIDAQDKSAQLTNSDGFLDGVLFDKCSGSFNSANPKHQYSFTSKEEKRFSLDECKQLVIHNKIGSITVVEHEHPTIEIQITKRGYTQEVLDHIEIIHVQDGGRVEITSIHPKPLATVIPEPVIKFPLLSSLWSKNVLINTSRIDYLICVPDSFIDVDLSTVVGDVVVYAGRGPVRAYSHYGKCFVSD